MTNMKMFSETGEQIKSQNTSTHGSLYPRDTGIFQHIYSNNVIDHVNTWKEKNSISTEAEEACDRILYHKHVILHNFIIKNLFKNGYRRNMPSHH